MHKYFDINDAGHSIRCKLYCHSPRDNQKLILFGHGFGGHKDTRAAERFAERVLSKYKHTAVLTFDWPAHGDDVKKSLQLADCDTYLTCVLRYIRTQLHISEIYGHATSFGGYLFLKYIHQHGNPFCKVALRGPAVTMYTVTTQRLMTPQDREKLEKNREILLGFDRKVRVTADFFQELQQNDVTAWEFFDDAEQLLLLHGTKDEIVPFADVYDFAEKNVIECIAIEGADHRFQDPAKMGTAIQKVLEFFSA